MRDLAFFEQVGHFDIPWRGRSICLPVFYYDVTTVIAAFLTPLDRVMALLPSRRMKPLRATPWHTVTVITAFEYRDTDIGPYNEVAIAFPFTLDRPAPVLTGLLRHIAEGPLSYVHHLPVTTQIAYQAGVDFYNYPKFLATIGFEREGEWIRCRLAEGNRHILTLTARQVPLQPFDHWRFYGITVRDKRILRSEIVVNVRRRGLSRNPRDARLELGEDHPIARELRELRLGRLVELQFLPQNQAILTPVVESYPLE